MANNIENLMGQGGSYTVDPDTQTLVLKERTKQPGEVDEEPLVAPIVKKPAKEKA